MPTPVDQARWIALLYLQHSEIPSAVVVAAVGPRLQGLGTTAYTVTAFLLWPEMERIMSKTNDTSKVAALDDHRPLRDSELDAVSGGAFPIVMAQIALLNSSQSGVDHQPLSISKVLD